MFLSPSLPSQSPDTAVVHDITAARQAAVERVIMAMRERMDQPLALRDMADIACLSPFHFHRVFHDATGIPPGEFLSAWRIQEAKRLLLTTSLDVADVCAEVGYGSLGQFTTRFTRLVGLPPGRLRRLAMDLDRYLDPLRFDRADGDAISSPGAAVTGYIKAPDVGVALIFVGLFPTPIPQGHPVACTLLHAPGAFRITGAPEGCYYLMAAAFPLSSSPLAHLLPDGTVRVGRAASPVRISGREVFGGGDVALRPVRPTDPPLLAALPLLSAVEHSHPQGKGPFRKEKYA